ncbi:MAG: acylhydrolase, partial [Bacteroidales bacterium]|nr:acylhydrolase [Bacteroidales bacterium]
MKRGFLAVVATFVAAILGGQVAFCQDWPNLARFREANEQLLQQPVPKGRVVFMGNSITENWVKFHPEFFNDNNFVGRGISGQTTPQMLVRFRQDVVALS